MDGEKEHAYTVIFNASKRETHYPSKNYKQVQAEAEEKECGKFESCASLETSSCLVLYPAMDCERVCEEVSWDRIFFSTKSVYSFLRSTECFEAMVAPMK